MHWWKRGFGLVSALVAAAVIAIAAAGLATAAAAASRAGRELGWRAEALSLARGEMERIFSRPPEDLSGTPPVEIPGWPGFTRAVAVEPLPDGGARVAAAVYGPAGEVVLYAERHPWPK